MRIYQVFTLLLLLVLSSLNVVRADELARDVFKIPLYPGTETFPFRSTGESLLAPPLATLVRVYKTSDGSALDAAKVAAFFNESLRAKGWTSDDPQQIPNLLALQTQVYENLPDGAYIQVAGQFKVWVAPQDGMFTIWMEQWHNSRLDQKTRSQVSTIVEKLKEFAQTQPTKNSLGNANALGWDTDYANEYLIEKQQFSMIDPTQKSKFDIGSEGILDISILTYRDAEVAQQELEQRLRDGYLMPRFANAVIIGKSLVIIEDHSFKQKEKVAALAAQLATLKQIK